MRTLLFNLILTCSLLTLAIGSRAQDFSNKGRDFWITFPAHVDGTQAVMGIYITSDKAATGQVQVGNQTIPFSITANGVRRIFLGANGDAPNTSVYLSQIEGIMTAAAIHVTSNQPVVVYAHIIRAARSGASLILPTNVWGREYLIPSYSSAGGSGANSGYGIITVVAKDANTVVEITPSITTRAGQPAGIPYTITLSQPGDVYQVQFPKDADISGSKVRSIATSTGGCKPIGVFSATTWSAFNCSGASGGDNLFQQLFPIRAFGKSFLTAPFYRKSYDIYRVFVTDPTTVVTRTVNGVPGILTGLQSGGFYEFSTNLPNKIDADKPITVVQYMTSQTCAPANNTINSDPEMVVLSPVEQTINNITVFSALQSWVPPGQSQVTQGYLNIIIKTVAAPSFRINGIAPTGAFQTIPGTAYSYLQEDITTRALSNPIQTLVADSSFSAIAYGYGNVESYGYNAGTNVKDQFQFISIKNEYATVNFPATCVNSPFNFAITLPYQPTELRWNFYGRWNDTTVTGPVPDSTLIVDGRTLYQYRLPGSYMLNAIGLYKVTVVAINPTSDGCSGEQQIDYEVEVFDKPVADFVWQSTGCFTDSLRFSDKTNGFGRPVQTWKWDFGDGGIDSVKNPVKKYATAGNYTVKQFIITDIGCFGDATKVVDVTTPPVAKFSKSALTCVGSSITLTDESVAVNGTLTKWYWDYGDGRKDTVLNNSPRTISYPLVGTYTVKLIVETQSGCRSIVFSDAITVHPYPVANFALPAAVCLPAGLAQFTDQSTISNGTQAQFVYAWSFGDGGVASIKNPTHNYSTSGPFAVKLTVTSGAGCIKDTIKTLTNVFAQPKAGFTIQNEICLRDSSIFTDASTATNQNLVKYYWNFGNGVVDSIQNPRRRYLLDNTYNIAHWVVSDKGCYSDTVFKQHIVHPLPTADFSVTGPVCENGNIIFNDISKPNVGALARWTWNLGDGTQVDVTNAAPINHIYTTTGNKQVTLVVKNDKGCVSDTLKRLVMVNAVPKPAFDLPEVCLTDAFALFNNVSTIADGTGATLTWQWNFGDPASGAANLSNAKNGQHKYNAVGTYPVLLQVTSAAGCVATQTQQLTVNGDKPKADFIVTNTASLCSNLPVTIQNKSTVNFGTITKTEVYWEWPNAAIVTVDDDPQPDEMYTHSYNKFYSPASKSVQVRFVSYSGGVCMNEMIKTIQLESSPQVVFQTIPSICLDAIPRLITQATDASAGGGSGKYFGTGVDAAGLFTPTVAGVGVHTIQYIHTSSMGCKDSATNTIKVWPRPVADFNVLSVTCVTQDVTLQDATVYTTMPLKQWDWDFGNGTTAVKNNGAAFTQVYSTIGNYTVKLNVTSDSGCVSLPVSKTLNIHPLPQVDFSLPTVCMPAGTAVFNDLSKIADGTQSQFTYQWNFGLPGATSTLKNPTYNYPAVGNYNVKLVVSSKDGCKDSLTKVLSDVNPQPLANFDINPPFVCIGNAISFTDRSNPLSQTITGWHWDFGDGATSSTQNLNHTYQRAGSFPVNLYYTTNKGCNSDTVTKTANVHPYPVVNAGPDLFVLEGGQAIIKATATGSSNYQYAWTPITFLNNPAIEHPTTKPLNDITYTLTVTGEGNCSSSDEVFVNMLEKPVIPNAFSPNGDGINDVWQIKYISSYPGAVVQVFDRYGKQIFMSTGYNTPWDGKQGGKELPIGVYYYVIDPKNGREPMKGSVTLIR
ncbi:MAG TPA: PKD domain-containing protein [Phnomibacter sp.]|nr:PKD domain-containing protein [Phnomibacter sp.]